MKNSGDNMQVKSGTISYKRNLCQNLKFTTSASTEITAALLLLSYLMQQFKLSD